MFEMFKKYIEAFIADLTDEQVNLMRSTCTTKTLRKRQMLLHEGEVCRHKIFVASGLLRNYSIAENGYEYILRFSDAGSWTTDPESYYTGLPSKYNTDAIESSQIVMFSRTDFDALKQSIPQLNAFSERIITKNASLTQQRVLMNISATAEEKYMDFINTYPDIFNRIPLHMVASYLGLSRETLIRIRQGLTLAGRAY